MLKRDIFDMLKSFKGYSQNGNGLHLLGIHLAVKRGKYADESNNCSI